jgi:membrane-bound serine protease (ClpP class)
MILTLAIVGLFFIPDPWRVVILVVAAMIEVLEVFFWIKFLRRYRVTTGAEGMLGELAVAMSALEPEGNVRVRGEIWNARSSGPVAEGAEVRVAAVDGLTLVVHPETQR